MKIHISNNFSEEPKESEIDPKGEDLVKGQLFELQTHHGNRGKMLCDQLGCGKAFGEQEKTLFSVLSFRLNDGKM